MNLNLVLIDLRKMNKIEIQLKVSFIYNTNIQLFFLSIDNDNDNDSNFRHGLKKPFYSIFQFEQRSTLQLRNVFSTSTTYFFFDPKM